MTVLCREEDRSEAPYLESLHHMVAVLLRDVVGDGHHQALVPIVHQAKVTTRRALHTRYAQHQHK